MKKKIEYKFYIYDKFKYYIIISIYQNDKSRIKLCIKLLLFFKIRIRLFFELMFSICGLIQTLVFFLIGYFMIDYTLVGNIFCIFTIIWLLILSFTIFVLIFGSNFFLSRLLIKKIDQRDFINYCEDYISLEISYNSIEGKIEIDNIINHYLKEKNANTIILNDIISDKLNLFEKMKSILYYIYKNKGKYDDRSNI